MGYFVKAGEDLLNVIRIQKVIKQEVDTFCLLNY